MKDDLKDIVLKNLLKKIEAIKIEPERFVGYRGVNECYEPSTADGEKVKEVKKLAKKLRKLV
ncbi:hypothetical protein KUL113_03920 [Tenacibaculum sp. KUL113]|nr:hypothetical protein KUL113_03920 [Tenacibaculum sp. KUL113]